jgi:hypothetical protein
MESVGSAGGYKSHSRSGRSCVMTSVETDFTKSTNSCVISYHIGRLKAKVKFTLQRATNGHKYRLSYSQTTCNAYTAKEFVVHILSQQRHVSAFS